MKQIKSQLFAFAIFILLISSCKKGDTGEPGNDGSANVTAYTFSVTSWTYSTPAWYRNLSVPELTSSNLNTASVQVYLGVTSGSWTALPNTFYNSPANYLMGFETQAGIVKINWIYDSSLSSGDDPNTFFGTNCNFKIVVIPAALLAANPDLDLKNYNAVKEKFKLKD